MIYESKPGVLWLTLKDGLVYEIWGFTLQGPIGKFYFGDSVERIRKKMGEPDSKGAGGSTYYRSGLVVKIDHGSDEKVRGFILSKMSRRLKAIVFEQRGYADW